MGHSCEILTFEEKKYTKQQIQANCDFWGNDNADNRERGGFYGIGRNIQFTNMIFDSYEDACSYLEGTFGNYRQIAVRYKQFNGKVESSKTLEDLKRRITEYQQRILALDEPHYKNVKVKTIKCKNCGSVLPTAFCGQSYNNNCPICKADLRPNTVLEKRENYMATLKELEKKYKIEQNKLVEKATKKGSTLYWAVACEVHC